MVYKTPWLLKKLYPQLIWQQPVGLHPTLYLTFDDGPIPDITPQVVAHLATFNAQATFFCIGDNVQKHPTELAQVLAAGHQVANHTFNHLNGWKTPTETYLKNVAACHQILPASAAAKPLFRPPYGRISSQQQQFLLSDYQIIMWSVLSQDYRADISPEKCFRETAKVLHDGAIIVFHDSQKAARNMLYTLPRLLEYAAERGYRFGKL